MTPERWGRLEQLFDAAVDLDESARAAFIARETASDAEMGEELESLLNNDGRQHVAEVIGTLKRSASQDAPIIGRRIGAYRLIREIGRGGMGAVYEAVRAGDFAQTAAIKLCGQAALPGVFRERFDQERQILASLQHPYIARLFDGGATDDGVPYFVMELVEGQSITAYCAAHSLSTPARLELFAKVCEAVEHAHQRLIVHRDLKPANIFVDTAGNPKLLDFGIAKLIDAAGNSPVHTMTVAAPITPDYASPEQVRGGVVTTRTDVYQLGLVLFEMLTGRRAQTAATESPTSLEQSICAVDLPLASAASGLRAYAGDIDTIVMTCVEKDPERRYDSVAQLAADVRRYLDNRPIEARRAGRLYRFRKFIARNRLAAFATAAVTIALIGGAAATMYQARRAERRFEQVRGIAHALLFDVEDAVKPLAASTAAQQVVVRTALDYLNALSQEAAGDRRLQLEIAEGYTRIAEIQGSLLEPSLARRGDAAESLRKSLAILEPLQKQQPADIDIAAALTSVYLLIAENEVRSGKMADGKTHMESAIAVMDTAVKRNPTNTAALRRLAQAYSRYNRDIGSRGKPNAEYAITPVKILEDLAAKSPADRALSAELAQSYSAAGSVFLNLSRAHEAAQYFEKSLRLNEAQVAAEPGNTRVRKSLMLAEANLGDAYWGFSQSIGDRDTALKHYRRMAEEAKRLLAGDPNSANVKIDYAMSLMRYGGALAPRDPDAARLLRESLDIVDAMAESDPSNSGLRRQEMDLCLRLAARHVELGEHDKALALWRKSMAIGESMAIDPANLGARTWLLRTYMQLGAELQRRGQRTELSTLATKAKQRAAEARKLDPASPAVKDVTTRALEWAAKLSDGNE